MTVEQSGRITGREQLLEGLPVEERRLDIDGVSTALLEGGQGRPVVLVHGATQAGGAVWWQVIPRLVETSRVIIPDLPGLGESGTGARRLDASGFGRWLGELIRLRCREQRPTLVAHSGGGALAARFAIEQGQRLDRLVLVGALGLGPFRATPPSVLAALLRSALRPGPATFTRLMRHMMSDLDRTRAQQGDHWDAYQRYLLSRAGLPSVKKAMRQLSNSAVKAIGDDALRRIAVPTALLWGRDDRGVPRHLAEAASDRLGWPLHVIDDAGHLPHVEQADAFVATLHAATADG